MTETCKRTGIHARNITSETLGCMSSLGGRFDRHTCGYVHGKGGKFPFYANSNLNSESRPFTTCLWDSYSPLRGIASSRPLCARRGKPSQAIARSRWRERDLFFPWRNYGESFASVRSCLQMRPQFSKVQNAEFEK